MSRQLELDARSDQVVTIDCVRTSSPVEQIENLRESFRRVVDAYQAIGVPLHMISNAVSAVVRYVDKEVARERHAENSSRKTDD